MILPRETVFRIVTAPDRDWRAGWRPVRVEASRLVAIHQEEHADG